MAQVIIASGQQHLGALRTRHQAGQHGGFGRFTRRQQVDQILMVPAWRGRQLIQRMQHVAQTRGLGQALRKRQPVLLTRRQDGFHQAQTFVVIHLRPASNLGRGSEATLAQAIIGQCTNANAGAKHGAESGIHGTSSYRRA